MYTFHRSLLSSLAAAAALSVATAGTATAETGTTGQPSLVHQTPKAPVVIDGVRYKPKAIHRFDGQEIHLKLRLGPKGKPELVVSRTAPNLISKPPARMSSPGGHVRFFERINGAGASFTRNHGESVSNLANVPTGCFIFCWGSFDNLISSVETNGAHTTLYDGKNFSGSSLEIPEEWDRRNNLNDYSFNDRATSLWVD
jgi:hypothetical protein